MFSTVVPATVTQMSPRWSNTSQIVNVI
jgi:hypothetical protein